MPRKHLESNEQQALIKWAELASGTIPQLKNLFAIPNGGYRNIIEAARFKREGVKAGVPDLFFAWPLNGRCGYHGLFIEMKAGKGKQSKAQEDWTCRLTIAGYAFVVCYSWIEAKDCILKYLGIEDGTHI